MSIEDERRWILKLGRDGGYELAWATESKTEGWWLSADQVETMFAEWQASRTPEAAPSDTDREALIDLRLATYTRQMSDGYNSVIVRGNEEAADLVIAAGFSRTPQLVACNCTQAGAHDYGSVGCESGIPQPSTVTEAQVEAAAKVLFEPPSTTPENPEYTWAEMVVEDPIRADLWRQDARAILEAARLTPAQPDMAEPTDVMVDAACRVYWDRGPTEFTIEWMTRALRAAFQAGE